MRISVLIDNLPGDDPLLQSEHGLSFYIELEGHRILCDMGASDKFLANARQMNIDLSAIDFAFVSHGHADHTGGLLAYLQAFEETKVYLSNRVFGAEYYSSRRGMKRNISTDAMIEQHFGNRLFPLDKSTWITSQVAAICTDVYDYSQPYGNCFLTKKEEGTEERPDDFTHELSLAIRTSEGLVIVSSCSHGGAVNIMRSCCRFMGEEKVYAFIGGLHLVDSERMEQEADAFMKEVRETYPDVLLYTGHCTSDAAKQALEGGKMNIRFFRTGSRINVFPDCSL